ncbi:hypothetical protein AURDEDRAFT_151611 [Auricularia subglabra TFB-10046 SS5]|nr:hypothetical protein AURDEDRAFT_151611 [Auricularia subglabra TFB-10046 SS5]
MRFIAVALLALASLVAAAPPNTGDAIAQDPPAGCAQLPSGTVILTNPATCRQQAMSDCIYPQRFEVGSMADPVTNVAPFLYLLGPSGIGKQTVGRALLLINDATDAFTASWTLSWFRTSSELETAVALLHSRSALALDMRHPTAPTEPVTNGSRSPGDQARSDSTVTQSTAVKAISPPALSSCCRLKRAAGTEEPADVVVPEAERFRVTIGTPSGPTAVTDATSTTGPPTAAVPNIIPPVTAAALAVADRIDHAHAHKPKEAQVVAARGAQELTNRQLAVLRSAVAALLVKVRVHARLTKKRARLAAEQSFNPPHIPLGVAATGIDARMFELVDESGAGLDDVSTALVSSDLGAMEASTVDGQKSGGDCGEDDGYESLDEDDDYESVDEDDGYEWVGEDHPLLYEDEDVVEKTLYHMLSIANEGICLRCYSDTRECRT